MNSANDLQVSSEFQFIEYQNSMTKNLFTIRNFTT